MEMLSYITFHSLQALHHASQFVGMHFLLHVMNEYVLGFCLFDFYCKLI